MTPQAILYMRVSKPGAPLLREMAACLSMPLPTPASFAALYVDCGRTHPDRPSTLDAALNHLELIKAAFLVLSSPGGLPEDARSRVEAAGARIVPVDPTVPLDPTLAGSLSTLLDVAEAARKALIVERIAATRRKLIEQGIVPAGKVPYGFRVVTRADVMAGRRPRSEIGTMEVDDYEAGLVRTIFDTYIRSRSTTEVAKNLQTRGIATPSGRGAWSASTVARILLKPAYVGRMEWGAAPVQGPSDQSTRPYILACPPIVEEQSFELAGLLLANNSRRAFRDNADHRVQRTLLSNIARCGVCGGPIVEGHYEPSVRLNRTGGFYYACRACPPSHFNANSPRPKWCCYKADTLEKAVYQALRPRLSMDDAEFVDTCVFRGDWNAPMSRRRRLLRQCGFTPYVTADPFEARIGIRDNPDPTDCQLAAMVHLLTTGARDLATETRFNYEFDPKSRPDRAVS
jgi:hypothetical protein